MLSILGFVFVIIAAFFVYRTAKQNGHNAVRWSLITFAVGVGFQIILPFLIVVIIGVIYMISGKSEAEMKQMIATPANIIGISGIVISIAGMLWVIRKVSSIAEEKPALAPPPPDDYNVAD